MDQRKKDRILLYGSVCGFFIMSVSFLLMPVDAMPVLPGLLFWIGLLTGVALQIVLEARRRAFFKSYGVKRQNMQKPRNGFLTFGSNRYATIADNVMAGSVIATVLAFIFTKGSGYLCYVGISVTLFSLCLHCIFNGRNYFHVNNRSKIQQTLESPKASNTKKGERAE